MDETQNFTYAPNPILPHGEWEDTYPPIKTTSHWLINKFTGEILPNTEEFARRSDILEPYLGELPRGDGGEVVAEVNAVLSNAGTSELSAL